MKSFILSMAFISTSFFGSTSNNDLKIENNNNIDQDALYCSASGTTSDGDKVELTCWFCDCKENIKALQELIED